MAMDGVSIKLATGVATDPTMVESKPHFLLFCSAHVSRHSAADTEPIGGTWHFVLERIDAEYRLEAADSERSLPRDRLSLLAVVRGLEALEQPSQVTLVTTSRYVSRGLRYGLNEWRESGYSWEHFGMQKPVRNADLWQRVDGALGYHAVGCRLLESAVADTELCVAAPAVQPELCEVAEQTAPQWHGAPVPAPHFPVRRAAMNSRRPRPRLSAPPDAWRLLAANWFQWWRGRAARSSLLAGA